MSSVSMSGGCSATLFASMQKSQAADRSQQLFSKLDVNGDGAIDSSELKTFADDINSKAGTKLDANSLLTALDSDGDGSVSSAELKDNGKALFEQLRQQLTGTQSQATAQPPDSSDLFNSIDTNGDGSISKTELDGFLTQKPDGGANAPSAPHHHHGGPSASSQDDDGIKKIIASLIAQYGATKSDDAATGSTLSVAA